MIYIHDIVLEVVGVIRKDAMLGSNSPGEEVLRLSLSFPRAAAEVKTQRLSTRIAFQWTWEPSLSVLISTRTILLVVSQAE